MKPKPVAKVDQRTGEIVHRYPSISEAARRCGCSPSTIRAGLKGEFLAVGFIWIYL